MSKQGFRLRKRKDTWKVFLSYRRSDSMQTAGRIFDRFTTILPGENVFFDVDTIPLGVDFRDHIRSCVIQSRVLLAVIGQNWTNPNWASRRRNWLKAARLEDNFVQIELSIAMASGIPVIPLLLEGARIPRPGQLPEDIKKLAFLNAAPVRPGRDFHADMDRIIERIRDLPEKADQDRTAAKGIVTRRRDRAREHR